MSRNQIIGLVILLAALCALPFLVSNYRTFQFTLVMIYSIALLGLNILTGFNGQISLGHGAFYAIGAYCTAILIDQAGMPYWATLPISGAVCLLVGFLFGLPALRLEGLYLALATFALGVSLPQLLKYHHFEKWTGGVQGIVIAKPNAPFDLPLKPDQWLYFFTLAVALVMFALAWNLLRGRVGRALSSIRASTSPRGDGREQRLYHRSPPAVGICSPVWPGAERHRQSSFAPDSSLFLSSP